MQDTHASPRPAFMNWTQCKALIASDLWRHTGKLGTGLFLKHFLTTPGFRYSTLLRLYSFTVHAWWCSFGIRQVTVLALHHYTIRYGIDISRDAIIGSGFYIGHFGGIFVNEAVRIGNNCNLSQGVTLGRLNRGDRVGCPTI